MLKSLMRSEVAKSIMSEINVTPLVDVCLVLVIIFMVTTTAFLEPPFEIHLPKAHTAEQTKEEHLFVAISPEGGLAINESQIESGIFTEMITQKIKQSRHKLVIIRADEEAKSGAVLDVLNIVKKAGARRITFGTEEIVEP
jgi:biopolymer transport protein ExbD